MGWMIIRMEMHGLIPEEPRPSTSRSIARFANSDSDSIFGSFLYLYLVFDVYDTCAIECKRR